MSDQIDRDQAHPLYEFTQVITHEEMHALVEELYRTYVDISWWHPIDKLKVAGGFSTARILLLWLHDGKPYDAPFIQNSSGIGGNHETIN